MGRPPCCDKMNVKRGLWTPEEDAKMLAYISTHGIVNWATVPIKAGLNRCGKSCRLRWTNYLRPDLKHDSFSPQEEDLIVNLHQAVGSRWSLIAKWLPGRTDNDVKNHWNTKLRKKLQKMGIDPVTHKPFSQIFSDYGNISSNPANQIASSFSSLTSNNSNFIPKQEPPSSSAPNPWGNFVPQFEIPQPNSVTEAQSSSSSSSSFGQSAIAGSNWNEFLVSDPVFEEQKQEVDVSEVVGSCDHGNQMKRFTDQSSSSFVDVILDKDREMRSQFPPLLDASFDY